MSESIRFWIKLIDGDKKNDKKFGGFVLLSYICSAKTEQWRSVTANSKSNRNETFWPILLLLLLCK